MHASRVAGYAPGGLLDAWDQDRLAEQGVRESDFLERVWDKGVQGGKVFSIALDSHPFILMYNTDVAEQADALRLDGKLQDISSPDEFVDVAQRMQSVTGAHGLSYGYLNDGAQMWRLFYTLFKQQGAEMDLSGSRAVVDTDAAVTSLEFMQKLLDGKIATASGDYATALSEFVSGQSGMFFTGVWELPTVLDSGIPFDAQPIPTLYGTPAAYADSHAFVLPHQTALDEKKRAATYEFVASILKDSFSWAEAGHIPAYQPIVQSPQYQELVPQRNYASAAEILNYDPEAWFTGSGSDFQNIFAEGVQGVLLAGDDAAAGFDAFIHRIDQLIAKPNPV
jgi:multiple sugar transport system substrate-binding protein